VVAAEGTLTPEGKEADMLVLARKVGETVKIGDDIELVVVRIGDDKFRLGISAPKDVRIVRSELLIEHEEEEA
jgi:carbon storage regulator